MTILTHGSDLSLAPTLGPLTRQTGRSITQLLPWLVNEGFTTAQLDITLPGLRPRELSDTGRRDLRATFARQNMTIAGLDLFIPRKDFLEDAKIDRATAAALAGIELAADLGRVPISIPLPIDEMDTSARAQLVDAAQGRGVPLAIHAEDKLDKLASWLDEVDQSLVGIALDTAALLAHHPQPDAVIHKYNKKLLVARLSDLSDQGLRCVVGQGTLDTMLLRLALDLAQNRKGPIVLDLRNMENTLHAATAGKAAWDNAALN